MKFNLYKKTKYITKQPLSGKNLIKVLISEFLDSNQ